MRKSPDTKFIFKEREKIVSSYIMSSYEQIPKENRTCKQCNSDAVETLCHFLYRCNKFTHIRNHYVDYPYFENLARFFSWKTMNVFWRNYILTELKLNQYGQ